MNPLTRRKIRRFKSIKRGYYAFLLLVCMILASLLAESLVGKRALMVRYEGKTYFPTYGSVIPGTFFGLDYGYETNYRELSQRFSQQQGRGNWVIMPFVPYDPYESDLKPNQYPPFPPSISDRHFLGTDIVGRDMVARLVYGFRIAIFFSMSLLVIDYLLGVTIGSVMGYRGGWFDLFFQRVIEIWSNVPVLYVIIIISSILVPRFFTLIFIMALFGWISMTWTMRTVTYREKQRDYILAARAMGASGFRIVFRHILPNTISLIVTYAPFSVAGGIVLLTSLDYLGFGLPAPTPSWGELLQQGWANMDAWWIATSVIAAMVITLGAVTFVGEAVREAFDPRRHTIYE